MKRVSESPTPSTTASGTVLKVLASGAVAVIFRLRLFFFLDEGASTCELLVDSLSTPRVRLDMVGWGWDVFEGSLKFTFFFWRFFWFEKNITKSYEEMDINMDNDLIFYFVCTVCTPNAYDASYLHTI